MESAVSKVMYPEIDNLEDLKKSNGQYKDGSATTTDNDHIKAMIYFISGEYA